MFAQVENGFFTASTAKDSVAARGEFRGQGAPESARDAGDKDNSFGHPSLQTAQAFIDAKGPISKHMLTPQDAIDTHAPSFAGRGFEAG